LVKEKIYGEESTRKIAQMEIALDLTEKEKEIELLKTNEKLIRLNCIIPEWLLQLLSWGSLLSFLW
jgi:hypothetical protein